MDNVLSEPFTVYTAFASALGRSAKGRVYAFIKTSSGDALSSLLVKKGLARQHGIGRESPGGISRNETIQRLQDLETAAMLKREGIWSESDPNRIAELRAEQRMEDQKLKELQQQVKKMQKPQQLIDLNTATKKELESIPGIGPVLAERIMAGRPYRNIDELLKIKGIGKKNLSKIRNCFVIKKDSTAF